MTDRELEYMLVFSLRVRFAAGISYDLSWMARSSTHEEKK